MIMDGIKIDLSVLGIELERLEVLTVKEAREAYYKAAKLTHPDKADRKNEDQVNEFKRRFQEIVNSYERTLRYLIKRLQENNETKYQEKTEVFLNCI